MLYDSLIEFRAIRDPQNPNVRREDLSFHKTEKYGWAIEGKLAESWEQKDDLTYAFRLRQGVKFHNVPPVNGRELTSEDVKYSIERQMTNQPGKFQHAYFFLEKLASIQTPDKYTIVFKTKEPYAPVLNYTRGTTGAYPLNAQVPDVKNQWSPRLSMSYAPDPKTDADGIADMGFAWAAWIIDPSGNVLGAWATS